MIDLTPLEVRQKKGDFRRSVRGYDMELVNDFLDLVADRMEELVKQNMRLQDSAKSLESELEYYREKQTALSDALMTAQKLREDARSHAEKEGELLIQEARMAAETARHEASRSLIREEETLRQVRARRNHLVQSFRRLLEREMTELAVIEESLELDAAPDVSGAAVPPAGKRASKTERPTAGPRVKKDKAEDALPAAAADDDLSLAAEAPADLEPVDEPAPEEDQDTAGGEDKDFQDDWLKSLVEE